MDEMKGTVIVYSRIGCNDSLLAKNLLASLGVPYLDISLDAFPKVDEQLGDLIGGPFSTPQIFFNNVRVSGYKDLRRLTASTDAWMQILEMLEKSENDSPLSDDDDRPLINGITPEDYQRLLSIFKKACAANDEPQSPRRKSLRSEELLNWFVREKRISDTLELGEDFIERNFGKLTNSENFEGNEGGEREDDPSAPLNVSRRPSTSSSPISVADMNERLCQIVSPLYEEILNEDRRAVYFDRLDGNLDFQCYLALSAEFPRVKVADSRESERLAFFINVYNIMLIHIIYKNGPHANVWQRRKYLNWTYYLIGNDRYSLQSIYNGILRGNRKGLGMLWKPFGKTDPRREFAIIDGEPLAHFGLNSYSVSTPPIRIYSTSNVYSELRDNAREFLEHDNLWTDTKKQVISLSEIFRWYSSDFGNIVDEAIEWIIENLADGHQKETLARIYLGGQYTVNYLPFSFDSNIIRELTE